MATNKKTRRKQHAKSGRTPIRARPLKSLQPGSTALKSLDLQPLPNPSQLYDWSSGASAQVEIVGAEVPFKINCTTQWRPAIRSPMQDMGLQTPEHNMLQSLLGKLKEILSEGDRLARSGDADRLQ